MFKIQFAQSELKHLVDSQRFNSLDIMDRSGNGGNKNENQERQQSLLDGSLWEQSNSEILVTLFREYTKKVNLQEVVKNTGKGKFLFFLILILIK